MSRVVIHTAKGPAIIKTKGGDTVAICRCGLTTNEDGTCCGNHHKTEDEVGDKLYQYNDKLNREEIKEDTECCGGCCEECGDKPDVL
jgi:CDGSH-type Zn-finger protein